jgi:hypothetical protein
LPSKGFSSQWDQAQIDGIKHFDWKPVGGAKPTGAPLLAQNYSRSPKLFDPRPNGKAEPIPTQWPNGKARDIPTQWPNLKYSLVESETGAHAR